MPTPNHTPPALDPASVEAFRRFIEAPFTVLGGTPLVCLRCGETIADLAEHVHE